MLIPILLSQNLTLCSFTSTRSTKNEQDWRLVCSDDRVDTDTTQLFLNVLIDFSWSLTRIHNQHFFLRLLKNMLYEWNCHLFECLEPLFYDLWSVVESTTWLWSAQQSLFHRTLVAFQIQEQFNIGETSHNLIPDDHVLFISGETIQQIHSFVVIPVDLFLHDLEQDVTWNQLAFTH